MDTKLTPSQIERIAKTFDESILKNFYSDPENVKAFNEWRKRKNAAEMQRNERN